MKLAQTLGLEYREEMACSLTDVSPEADYYEAVCIMLYYRVLNTASGDRFDPEGIVARMEMASILKQLVDLAPNFNNLPPDVPSNAWYANAVGAVLEEGLMTVDEEGKFRPTADTLVSDVAFDEVANRLGATTSGTVRLDLSAGSIEIRENKVGITVYRQGESVIRGGNVCIVRQSDTSAATANTISVEGGNVQMTVVELNIAVSADNTSPIEVNGVAALTLNLVGENRLIATSYSGPGIRVTASASLVIEGTGSLKAEPGYYHAGIGSRKSETAGNITINGGTIDIDTRGGAAIGGGEYGCYGTITINGGTVYATGVHSWGTAGIGSGYKAPSGGKGITITGGTVKAWGDESGTGISAGEGKLLITGGEVYACGGYGSSGCGSGLASNNEVRITDAEVTAVGGKLERYSSGTPGIGGGDIVIENSTVSAYSKGNCEGIRGSTVTIRNSQVTVNSSNDGISIKATEEAGITIDGGTVTAQAGIGGKRDIKVAISNANVTASSIMGSTTKNEDSLGAVDITGSTVTLSDGCYEKITIREQPVAAATLADHTVQFAVDAYGYSGLSYQWQELATGKGWANLEGQTGSVLKIQVPEEKVGYYYRCQLTNGWGNVLHTNSAKVNLLAFSMQPESVEVNLNDTAALKAQAACDNVSYHWERSYDDGVTWVDVPGEVYPTLVVDTSLSENGALYRCVITAANGDQLASDSARITVNSDAVTYTIRDYLQNADGKTYTVTDQTVVEAAVDDVVSAPDVFFEGYTRNLNKGVVSGTVTADSGLVLERYYDRNTYAITFDMQGGSALPAMEAIWGADVTRPADPSRYGFTFGGWYADSACTQEYAFDTMPMGGATVYAKWVSGDEGRNGVEYVINNILLRDGSTYEPVSGIPAGKLLAEISVTNLCSTHTDTVMLVTYDKDGRMLDLGFLYAGVPVGSTFTFGMEVDNTDGKVGEIKAFVLSSLNSTLPLAEAKSYDGT